MLLQCRRTYEAKSASVQAVAAALKGTFEAEAADLKAELAAARSSEAKSAARAKAERQNAHTTGRERAQSELKEVLADQYALQLRCWLACSAQTCFLCVSGVAAELRLTYTTTTCHMAADQATLQSQLLKYSATLNLNKYGSACNLLQSKRNPLHNSMSPPGAQRPEGTSPLQRNSSSSL